MTAHYSEPLETLFPGKARRAVLAALFAEKHAEGMSMSELARRAGLTPRAMAVEVRKLEASGVVSVESVGTAHVVRPVASSPVVKALRALLKAMQAPPRSSEAGAKAVRASLTAFGALERSDVVLCPAFDGGYYLMALRGSCDALFEEISWSTSLVLAETEARARQAGLDVCRIEARGDLDTVDDLRACWSVIRQMLREDDELVPAVERVLTRPQGDR